MPARFSFLRREHVVEAVAPRLASRQPDRRSQGAAREDVAIARAMGQLDALPVAGKDDGVLAGNITGAQRSEADLAGQAHADLAVAFVACVVVERDLATFGDRGTERQRGARRRILLAVVMELDNLAI